MCGRFTLRANPQAIIDHFQLELPFQVQPRFNIAPTQPILTVRQTAEASPRTATLLSWGLVPSWSNRRAAGRPLINARAETLASKRTFAEAFRYRRCLIPADGYYEWAPVESKKQPYLIHFSENQLFAFAGLWEASSDGDSGELVESCTIVTAQANALTQAIHHRMPVILDREDYTTWLTSDASGLDRLQSLLVPYDCAMMRLTRVGSQVNRVQNDDPSCVDPATLAVRQQRRLF